ncbi:MAG: oligoribonuclease [Gammaproteobacteria bacterium]|nr:oligoribonuclease [Gammaproteobacteria bacterium]
MKKSKNLIWIDLEMTGLNPQVDCIIEIALVVTDSDLTILAEAPVFAIHQSDEQLAKMDAWNIKHHGASGLIERVKESLITEVIAESEMLHFLEKWVKKGTSPMCGNTIWQDRRFLSKYMPALESYFHYRLLDVSTFKECAKRWEPSIYKGFKKQGKHQALLDIQESIEELKYYRENWLCKRPE